MECYNLFSGVELSMRSFFVISIFRRKGLARPQSPFPVFPECQLHCSQ